MNNVLQQITRDTLNISLVINDDVLFIVLFILRHKISEKTPWSARCNVLARKE